MDRTEHVHRSAVVGGGEPTLVLQAANRSLRFGEIASVQRFQGHLQRYTLGVVTDRLGQKRPQHQRDDHHQAEHDQQQVAAALVRGRPLVEVVGNLPQRDGKRTLLIVVVGGGFRSHVESACFELRAEI